MNKTSRSKLEQCHQDIIRLALAVDNIFPIQCICGARNKEEQDKAFEEKKSNLKFPHSKHNINPDEKRKKSHAADFVPDPDRNPATLDWGDIKSFEVMCLTFEQVADELNIKIKLGRDFRSKIFPNGEYPHVELS